MPQLFSKDEDEKLDYSIEWGDWLDDDTISTSAWTVADGLTLDSDSLTTTRTTVWISGGVSGTSYDVTNHIVTAAGREADRTLLIMIAEQ